MEEELLNIQKLESIRVLAGGIAHDFDNLLTSIVGNISIAKRYAAVEARLFGIVTDLEKASFRAHDLTNQLLTFSKGGAPVKKVASLSDIIRESADFALRGSQLICKFMIADDLWPAEVDVGQISQVMNNIVINASQAMPQGGAIEILAENVIGNTQKAPIPQGRCVKISIGDHGAGIPEKYLPKIFDPFFTTKQEGSGLGLATAYSIIRKHSGHITVETKEALGTTFHVYLPASDEEVSKNGLTGKRVFAGKGRVLLMDDEDIIRLIVDSMLHELGYQSDTVENGEHAIERYMAAGEEGRPFDAVIIDLTIRGGMGGTETIRKLREIDPDVRAIVSSGYFNDPIMSSYREFGFKGVITKPYRIEDLSEVLYKVLHGITDYHV
jgi:two-component system cell cycle sensor histidine kinase/response regulator CckA